VSLEHILNEHRELLNALVESIQAMRAELDGIRATQVDHGTTLAALKLSFDRSRRDSTTPFPHLSKIGSRDGAP